jgi:hypothetical protein
VKPVVPSPRRIRQTAGNAAYRRHIDRAQLACAGYGLALLVAPAPILRALPGSHDRPDRRALLAARALGARHLIQAVAIMQRPTRRWMLAGAGIDATHAATMLTLAAVRPNRRAVAATSATLAMVIAAAEIRGSRSTTTP